MSVMRLNIVAVFAGLAIIAVVLSVPASAQTPCPDRSTVYTIHNASTQDAEVRSMIRGTDGAILDSYPDTLKPKATIRHNVRDRWQVPWCYQGTLSISVESNIPVTVVRQADFIYGGAEINTPTITATPASVLTPTITRTPVNSPTITATPTISRTPTITPTGQASSELITMISRPGYVALAGGFKAGTPIYANAPNLTLAGIPAVLVGADILQTLHTENNLAPGSSDWLSFYLSDRAAVYVLHGVGLARPGWLLSQFADTGQTISVGGVGSFNVFTAVLGPGSVTLGSNRPSAGSTYYPMMAIAAKRAIPLGTATPTTTPLPIDTVTLTPTDTTTTTPTATASATSTATPSETSTETASVTASPTETSTVTETATATTTETATPTASFTPTATFTATWTATPTMTATETASVGPVTMTPSVTPTAQCVEILSVVTVRFADGSTRTLSSRIDC